MAGVGQVLGYGARRVGGYFAGDDPVERTAGLLATAAVGASFEPGLLPRGGTDQAIVTGIITASQYGLVVTSQSFYASLAHLIARDDGTRAGAMRSAAAQAAVSAGVAVTGAAVHQLLPPRRGEPLRRAVVRNAGRRAVMVGGAGVVVSHGGATWTPPRTTGRGRCGALSSGCGLLVGAAFAAQRIHRFRTDDPEEDARLAPPVDPLTRRRRRHADDRPDTRRSCRRSPAASSWARPSAPGCRAWRSRRARSPGCSAPACAGSRRGQDRSAGFIGHATAFAASSAGILGRHRVRQPQGRGRRRRHRRGVHDAARRCTRSAAARRPGSSGRRCRARACGSSTSR